MYSFLSLEQSNAVDIYSILGRMQVAQEMVMCGKAPTQILPFLYTYFVITKTVALRKSDNSHTFKNPEQMEKLDAIFAGLFFLPFNDYLYKKPVPRPWQSFFEYCNKPKGRPFLQMLLGINAHINGDLAMALVESKYKHREDFLTINKILLEEIPTVLKYLVLRKDALALGALALPKQTEFVFRKIIVQWREDAWQNAEVLRKSKNKDKLIHHLHMQTEKMAQILIHSLDNTKWPELLLTDFADLNENRVII